MELLGTGRGGDDNGRLCAKELGREGLIMLRNLLKQLKFRHFGCFSPKLGVVFTVTAQDN